MTAGPAFGALVRQMTVLRRDLHAHPELAFDERRTSNIVAELLTTAGLRVHRGLAETGVVATLQAGRSGRAIALRADMDALPLQELNEFAHRSTVAGRMHACGHDGHVAMLAGAASWLAREPTFDGTVHFVFQPAEEMAGGGRAMVEQGLFERFPVESAFALHNWPGLPVGQFATRTGPMMAGADTFEIVLTGRGSHAAMPHEGRDVVLAGSALVQALQAIASRNVDPLLSVVVSVTRFQAGHADNILPGSAVLGGTVRMFDATVRQLVRRRMEETCRGIALQSDLEVRLDYRAGYPPTVNAAGPTATAQAAAREVFGTDNVFEDRLPSMGAEDFAYLAEAVPACYGWIGNGPAEGGCVVHSPTYDFNDALIAYGLRFWRRLVERSLPRPD